MTIEADAHRPDFVFSAPLVPARRPSIAGRSLSTTLRLLCAAIAFGGLSAAAMAQSSDSSESDRAYCERQVGSAKEVCMRQLERAAKKKDSSGSSESGTSAVSGGSDADRQYCMQQQDPAAREVCLRQLDKKSSGAGSSDTASAEPSGPADGKLYEVKNGNQVDARTLDGFHTWRAAACDRCHGANQEGMVGPSLINSLKVLTKDQFKTTVTEGRLPKGMPSFKTNKKVMENLDALYAYLKGRSDGAIKTAQVKAMD